MTSTSCILLLLDHRENRRLLAECLLSQYQVLSPEDEVLQAQLLAEAVCDLVIIDGVTFQRLHEGVERRRQAEELRFLPFLLVSTQMDKAVWETPALWQRLDEHIEIPCAKAKLQTRIVTLLRARKLSLELQVANDCLEDMNQMKSQFISIVSHEFRNSMNSISGFAQLLERSSDPHLSTTQTRMFEGIRKAVSTLDSLVSDLLVLGRTGTSKLKYQPEPLNLETFCRLLWTEFELANNAQQEIVTQVRGDFSEVVMDPKLLNHLLTNLISNAIKYSSPQSKIYCELSTQGDLAQIVIKDEGIGIPLDSQAHLFDSFHRASNVGNIPGTGLGLMITKQCVELHQGQIAISSEPDIGTTCTVLLPMHAVD